MNYRDTFVATIALALGTLAIAGVIASGAYGQAAGAEARGVHALSTVLAQAIGADAAPTTLAAAPEVTR
ncbi:hypothetical protein [Massilia niabensis]|uniref:Uncharacterized protein n=1 Tax=Massilia niabensis TaxID=544910 RepID=A0ABW0L5W8_9BURK